MFINHKQKKVIAFQWERMQVCNFLVHCKPKGEQWSVHFINGNEDIEAVINNKPSEQQV